jgi:uncharacterized membrane protein HdeD (DUF308 family)
MQVARRIFGVIAFLLGVFDLYRAFQNHGDFMTYLIGGLFIVMGVMFFFARFPPKSQQ